MKDNDPLDNLARMVASGEATITNVMVNVCGKCYEGTFVSTPTPNWMNCWTCNKCGKKVSK